MPEPVDEANDKALRTEAKAVEPECLVALLPLFQVFPDVAGYPVRYKTNAKSQAMKRPFLHVLIRKTV